MSLFGISALSSVFTRVLKQNVQDEPNKEGRRRWRLLRGAAVVGALGLVIFALSAARVWAATITVANGEVAVAANGKCSLIEAIHNANDTNNGRPHADCAAGNPNGADTINLPKNGSFVLTSAAVNDQRIGPIGLPWLTSQVTINGNGSTIQRDNQVEKFRVLAVGRRANVQLNQVIIRGGWVEGCNIDGDYGGGGIFNEGKLIINNSAVNNNEVVFLEALDQEYCHPSRGGGIFNKGELIVANSEVNNNSGESDSSFLGGSEGGGIYNSGTMQLTNSIVNGNVLHKEIIVPRVAGFGGGIYNAGSLTITSSTISNNEMYSWVGSGGGIDNSGDLAISQTSIVSNNVLATGAYGGGISNSGNLTVERSNISTNQAFGEDGLGGGILNEGKMTLIDSLLQNNSARSITVWGKGGGIASLDGETFIFGSIISGNEAEAYDNELEVNVGIGGGIYNGWKSLITISNSTISANLSNRFGGGVANSGQMDLIASTLSRNRAGIGGGLLGFTEDFFGERFYCSHTTSQFNIISGNFGSEGREVQLQQAGTTCTSSIQVNAYNVFGFGSSSGLKGIAPGATDVIPVGASLSVLSPLANNGGPTFTHALPAGSSAIDIVPNTLCQNAPINGVDQRGYPRNINGAGQSSNRECDAGAFEYLSIPGGPTPTSTTPPTATSTHTPTPTPTSSPTPTGTFVPPTPTATGSAVAPTETPSPTATRPTELDYSLLLPVVLADESYLP